MSKDNKQFDIKITNRSKSRYGADELSTFLVIAGLVVGMIASTMDLTLLGIGALLLLVLALYRMTSSNCSARRKENRNYLEKKNKVMSKFSGSAKSEGAKATGKSGSTSSTKKEISCPMCSGKMNIPTGKGSIRVTCPTCKHKFTTQS